MAPFSREKGAFSWATEPVTCDGAVVLLLIVAGSTEREARLFVAFGRAD
jgi:hypothetical protein